MTTYARWILIYYVFYLLICWGLEWYQSVKYFQIMPDSPSLFIVSNFWEKKYRYNMSSVWNQNWDSLTSTRCFGKKFDLITNLYQINLFKFISEPIYAQSWFSADLTVKFHLRGLIFYRLRIPGHTRCVDSLLIL